MSVQSELTRLTQAKAAIKMALESKGVTVSEAATLDQYADIIAGILMFEITNTTGTLSASGWSNGSYSFESTYPISQYDIDIQPDGDSITAEQLEAWSAAMLVGSITANKVRALGDVPTVDIPIIIKAMKKI